MAAVFAVVVAVGVTMGSVWGRETGPVGKPVPDAEFVDFEGNSHRLGELAGQGRPLLVNLWASWCEPCRREFPALSEYAASHPEVIVVGIAVEDDIESARRFVAEMAPRFLVGFDASRKLRRSLPYHGLPTTYLISAEGTVLAEIMAELTPARLAALDFGP